MFKSTGDSAQLCFTLCVEVFGIFPTHAHASGHVTADRVKDINRFTGIF